jgi:hypothetical protein
MHEVAEGMARLGSPCTDRLPRLSRQTRPSSDTIPTKPAIRVLILGAAGATLISLFIDDFGGRAGRCVSVISSEGFAIVKNYREFPRQKKFETGNKLREPRVVAMKRLAAHRDHPSVMWERTGVNHVTSCQTLSAIGPMRRAQ